MKNKISTKLRILVSIMTSIYLWAIITLPVDAYAGVVIKSRSEEETSTGEHIVTWLCMIGVGLFILFLIAVWLFPEQVSGIIDFFKKKLGLIPDWSKKNYNKSDEKTTRDLNDANVDVYCKKCGNKIKDDSIFCKKCGNKIDR